MISSSLFLPQYETLTDGMFDNSFSFLCQYPNKDQSGGFFGGGYYTTFNGFGSINAILNVLFSFSIMIMLVSENLSRKNLNYLIIIIALLQMHSLFDLIAAPYFLNEPDVLKIGFYILRIMEAALLYLAYFIIKELPIPKIELTDLIDN